VDQKVPDLSYQQLPQMKIVGSNFSLASQTSVLAAAVEAVPASIPATPTHILMSPSNVRQFATEDAPIVVELKAGTTVRLLEASGGWALIAREGRKLGYVDSKSLLQMQ
jgi:uncharacterized protein YgiM (DUF1202 family)